MKNGKQKTKQKRSNFLFVCNAFKSMQDVYSNRPKFQNALVQKKTKMKNVEIY